MLDDVQVVSAQEFLCLRDGLSVPPSFRLRFPRLWLPQPLQNRYADVIEKETISWLQSYGIGRGGKEEELLRKFNCAQYGGYSLPLANYHTGLLVLQFISLWLFWDDMQVEEEQNWDIDEVLRALTENQLSHSPSRYVAAWFDIGRRLRETQSRRWLEHLASTMRQWLTNAKVETSIARTYQLSGACPEVTGFFDCRTISIGMFPSFHLMELTEGFELPDSVHADETIVALKRLASRLVGMGNDLGGLAKDIRNCWLNLVIVMADKSALTIKEAFQKVVDIHNADVKEFDYLASMLPQWGGQTDALIQGWLQVVRYSVYGFTLWESTAQRYQEWKAFSGRTALIAPVDYYEA